MITHKIKNVTDEELIKKEKIIYLPVRTTVQAGRLHYSINYYEDVYYSFYLTLSFILKNEAYPTLKYSCNDEEVEKEFLRLITALVPENEIDKAEEEDGAVPSKLSISDMYILEQQYVKFVASLNTYTKHETDDFAKGGNNNSIDHYLHGKQPNQGITCLNDAFRGLIKEEHNDKESGINAVYSYWTAPFGPDKLSLWYSLDDELSAWNLSLKYSRKHFSKIKLYTDTRGYNLLIKKLKLEFDEIDTETFDGFTSPITEFWSYGKYVTYSKEKEPFIHMDFDLFLFKKLPPSVLYSPLFASHPEYTDSPTYTSSYPTKLLLDEFERLDFPYVPTFLRWYLKNEGSIAYNTGIIGGTNIHALNQFGKEVTDFIEKNEAQWRILIEKYPKPFVHVNLATFFDQYMLAAFHYYYSVHKTPWSAFGPLNINTLYPDFHTSVELQRKLGVTHLFSKVKRNKKVLEMVQHLGKNK